jgi:bifunctional polynucleotide phosphatase/kinase
MIIKINKPYFRSKIALFDYDSIWIKGQRWVVPTVPEIITDYYKKGYGIYIVTNQTKTEQIELVMKTLGIPLTICMTTNVFTPIQKDKIKYKTSFICGNIVADIKLKVHSPDEIFKIKTVKPVKHQEIVIMVGYPGSGKSTICSEIFEPANYYIAHGDELKTSAKMIKMAEAKVANNQSVVFDATNPTKDKRAEYIMFAKKHNLPVRCIHVNTSMQDAMTRNNLREKPIPNIVFYTYRKKFESPEESEGFKLEIV